MSQVFIDVVNAVCWGAVVLTWVGGTVYNVTHAPPDRQRTRLGQTTLILVAAVCAAIAVVLHRYWHNLTVDVMWVRVLGLVVLIPSAIFTVWARITLGTMWSLGSEVKDNHQLRTGGPYAVTRHPIYTGLLGMLLGTGLLNSFGRWIILFPVGLILLTFKANQEERLLLKTFGQDFRRYQGRVPLLIPGIYALRRRRHVPAPS